MRLTCPNCGAQYAVDNRVIPDSGRDVQCSACGHTWFQEHPDQDRQIAEALDFRLSDDLPGTETPEPAASPDSGDLPAESPPETETAVPEPADSPQAASESVRDDSPAEAAEAEPEPEAEPEAEAEAVEGDRVAEPPSSIEDDVEDPAAEPERPKVDEEAMSVLREEAAREQAARQAESASLETQPDLGVESAFAEPRQSSEDYSSVPAEHYEPKVAISPGGLDAERGDRTAPRRDLLPDVEEINSTLEPGGDAAASRPIASDSRRRAARKRGSRIGLVASFLIFGGLAFLYGQADQVGDAIPSAAEPLAGYVQSVNDGRIWLDEAFRGTAGQESAGAE